jgi:putative NADH-flavin reductase
MKICIFGAAGRTGVEVVHCARGHGFEVVAFVRGAGSNRGFPTDVAVQRGDVMDYASVLEAIRGSGAVISVLGHVKGSAPFMQTKGMFNLVKAMGETGIKRVLSLTGTGARVEGDKPSFLDRVLNCMVGIVDPARINDGVEHIKVLRESNLDWTVVRVLKLGNSNREIKQYKLTAGGPAEPLTSRKKAARVLVDLVNNNEYTGRLPIISG